ncbi:SDR family oxidoreductase [Mesorhizobium sp.]|uniref:SDR family oxidoreductase n=1 Tax=Mesorhizobium sp. TaxID=1871066 RepID=UPI000FE2B08F|nr:SDR family oxidoreductase [Mesorhizobium sp.]RWH72924.1 MAG: SDR family oxidoreductase [Mesorhizobium sp.]RWL34190.1 MAG: SDR family oxidoreductase [Mesorhizobium sp.]RWL35606.1 MAG: SDR family oxidoreductase [Mesorhizobium sp.]RWL41016.1 MAG: SDR family oxidoreductase [Mesorhizobium sp.]RWL52218.1 MAG: SDR family oxidoreductase [Mesorhizobium sp.]
MQNVSGKVVLITGASSGIGEEAARVLARAGATVVLGARRTERLRSICDEISAAGSVARACSLDVTDRKDVAAFAQQALSEFGRIDVLVNNAGIFSLSFLSECDVDTWDRMIDVNIKGVLYGIAAVLPIMNRQETGHIINIASIAGLRAAPTGAVYCATKYAVRAISQSLRQETQKIRVTSICPGVVETPIADNITDETGKAAWASIRPYALQSEDVANAILFAIAQPNRSDINEIVLTAVDSTN